MDSGRSKGDCGQEGLGTASLYDCYASMFLKSPEIISVLYQGSSSLGLSGDHLETRSIGETGACSFVFGCLSEPISVATRGFGQPLNA